jgi:hypothetical protein
MALHDLPPYAAGLPRHDIRALPARIAHADDPLAVWKTEFDDWRQAIQEFKAFERTKLEAEGPPSAFRLRQHRWLLLLLMSRGEELALVMSDSPKTPVSEAESLIRQVDAFLDDLRMSWTDWHSEPSPAHKEVLDKFVS